MTPELDHCRSSLHATRLLVTIFRRLVLEVSRAYRSVLAVSSSSPARIRMGRFQEHCNVDLQLAARVCQKNAKLFTSHPAKPRIKGFDVGRQTERPQNLPGG